MTFAVTAIVLYYTVFSSYRYVIIKKLGAGGFGDVYEVHRERDKGVLAMKTEFDVEDDILQRLKVSFEVGSCPDIICDQL